MRILPYYSSISLIDAQSHNHRKYCTHRICLFWTKSHIPHDIYPTKELYFLSKSVNDLNKNDIGFNLATFLIISKRNYPVSCKTLTARCDYLSTVGCISIYPMKSMLQSFLRKIGLPGSNIA